MKDLKNIEIDSKKLREIREQLGFSMPHVADQIGISQQRLWNYEAGRHNMPAHLLARFCILCRVPIEVLTKETPKNLEKDYKAA